VRNRKQTGIARVLQAIALERAQIIRIAKLRADLLEEVPVMLLAFRANLLLQMALEVGGDAVIIEQRVVNVEEEDEVGHGDGENLYQNTPEIKNDGLPQQPMSIASSEISKRKRPLPWVAVERLLSLPV